MGKDAKEYQEAKKAEESHPLAEAFPKLSKIEAKKRFFEWYTTPVLQRVPALQKDLCIYLGVTPATLYKWRREVPPPGSEHELATKIDEVDRKMHDEATKGKVKAAELWYKRHGLLVEKTESKVELVLNADQLDQISRGAADRVREAERIAGKSDRTCGLPPERPLLLP